MTTLETLRQTITRPPANELVEFRRWFAEFDAAAWDAQMEADATAGKLDDLATEALGSHASETVNGEFDETAYLLQSPANAKRLFDAKQALEADKK